MPCQLSLFKIVLSPILGFPGLISNLFIVSSILVQMRLEGSLQTANILMACNSLNNLALVSFTFTIILALELTYCPSQPILVWLLFVWEMLSVMQMWGITLICVFYCLKVVPGKGCPALWLRRNFGWVAGALMTVGLVFSLGSSFINHHRAPPKNVTWNSSCPYVELPKSLMPVKTAVSVLLHVSVFALVTYSCAAPVAHLCGHVWRMRGSQPGVGGAKQWGVARVALMIFLLAVEFGCCTIVSILLITSSKNRITCLLITDISLVNLTLSCLIPITLIAGISSLRESVTSCCVKA